MNEQQRGFHQERAEAIYGPPEALQNGERSPADSMHLLELAGVIAQYFRYGDSEASERLDIYLHVTDSGLRAADVLDNFDAAIVAEILMLAQGDST